MGQSHTLLDHDPHELDVRSEMVTAVAVASVPGVSHVLTHLVALVGAPSYGLAQSDGCCSSVVAVVARTNTLFCHRYEILTQ